MFERCRRCVEIDHLVEGTYWAIPANRVPDFERESWYRLTSHHPVDLLEVEAGVDLKAYYPTWASAFALTPLL